MARVNVIRSPRPVSVSSGIFPWFRQGTYVDLLLLADIFCPRCLFLSVFLFCSRRDFFCCYRCCTFFCPHRSFSRPLSGPVRSGPIPPDQPTDTDDDEKRVLYLAMSPDGQTIVTGAGDETLRFWNAFPGPKSREGSGSAGLLFPAGVGIR